jgi:lipopolysaccharide/colanic/teichoic acid biosynthesis glycosyltransferase
MNDHNFPSLPHLRRMQRARTHLGRCQLQLALHLKRASWLILVHGTRVAKRLLDIAIATPVLLLSSPVLLVVAGLIRLDGGPVFFRQQRIGYLGRTFGMWKFRSMCVDAESRLAALLAQNEKAGGVTFKMAHDPRITRVGRWIRRTSIDELPQLLNVLAGEMSIVGPRPPLAREVALYSVEDRRRLLAVPGITGLWQVGERAGGTFEIGDRNAIDFDEQVRLDINYIEQHSIWRDLWIMLKTPPAMLLGK